MLPVSQQYVGNRAIKRWKESLRECFSKSAVTMYSRPHAVRYDRVLQYFGQRNPQSLCLLVFSLLCVFYIIYRLFFTSSTYQLELEAASNSRAEQNSRYNLNHNLPDSAQLLSAKQYSTIDNSNSPSQSLRASSLLYTAHPSDAKLDANDIFSDWLPPLGAHSVPDVDTIFFSDIDNVYVIPGGGSGLPLHRTGDVSKIYNSSNGKSSTFETAGYPEWTRRRTSAAFAHYSALPPDQQKRSLFLALSAGSLNAPNVLLEDRRVMFECQHTLQHLAALGVDSKQLFGDWFSWDTVTNAVALRQFLDGLLLFRGPQRPRLVVQVFISDFHHQRMRQAISWVLSLRPQALVGPHSYPTSVHQTDTDSKSNNKHDNNVHGGKRVGESVHALKGRYVEVVVQVVDSLGLGMAEDSNLWKARLQHEEAGVQQLQSHQSRITSMRQLQAFLFLGGHGGLHKYLLQDYYPSKGPGW